MPDAWETAHGLNPLVADSSGNPDGDSLTNLQEYNAGSDPQVFESNTVAFAVSAVFTVQIRNDAPDQDGDGLPDAWEIANGLNPTLANAGADPDGDGLTNLQEYLAGRIPNLDDLSGEGAQPSVLFSLDTIGLAPDTDHDGMPDAWEIAHGLNPLVANAGADPDGDGRTNLEEYNADTDPLVNDWLGPVSLASVNFLVDTGAYNGGYSLDTDGDGMPDFWEARYGLPINVANANGNPDLDDLTNIQEYNAGTNPLVFDFLFVVMAEGNAFLLDTGGGWTDSDGDGIPDWWERNYTGSTLAMQPGADLDGDGKSNLEEYLAGLSPLDPRSRFSISNSWMQTGPGGPEFVVQWSSQPGRFYRIFVSQTLGAWPATPSYEIAGDGLVKTFTSAISGATQSFIKIEVHVVNP